MRKIKYSCNFLSLKPEERYHFRNTQMLPVCDNVGTHVTHSCNNFQSCIAISMTNIHVMNFLHLLYIAIPHTTQWKIQLHSKHNTKLTVQPQPTVNKVKGHTTIRDKTQGDSIREHRHPYGPTPTRGRARQEHVSTKHQERRQGNLSPSRSDQTPRTTQHFQGVGQRTSLPTSTTKQTLPQIELISSLY